MFKMVSGSMAPHLFFSLLLCASCITQTNSEQLIFADEFNVDGRPDPSVWSYDLGDWGWGNAELQLYTDDANNAVVENGKLVIRARSDGDRLTSARIKTLNKVTFQYGRVEASIEMPDLRNGLWPAFWTLGNDFPTVGWPACGEIDIVEMGHSSGISEGAVNRKVGSAAHWEHEDNDWATYWDYWTGPTNLNVGFHNFTLNWTPNFIETFVDGQSVWKMDISHPSCPAGKCSEFHKPHFFLLNMAIGGRYTGILAPSGITANFPAELRVDHVRLYANQWTQVGGSYFGEEKQGSHELSDCGCPATCTGSILNRPAAGPEGSYSCRERIEWVISNLHHDERDACALVASDFPSICGDGCNSMTCPKETPPPTFAPTPPPTPRPTAQRVPNPPGPPGPTPRPIDCGCYDHCAAESLDQMADGATCRARIQWIMDASAVSEGEACFTVSEDFPAICGKTCNLFNCDWFEDPPEGGTDDSKITCGCASCNKNVLNLVADGFTCLERISWLMEAQGKSELQACRIVGQEFPDVCGGDQCDPDICRMDCSCGPTCQPSTLDRVVRDLGGPHSCRDRIFWLLETGNSSFRDACAQVSEQFPSVCGQGCHPGSCNISSRPTVLDCGCPVTCLDQVLDQDAAGQSCRDRINWVMGTIGSGEEDACSLVSDEFPNSCARGCDPRFC